MQSGPVSQRTDLEDRRNPVARGRQPAASQFSGRLAKGAIPDFDKFLDDRLLWLHTNVGRHDNRGNNVVTHRNCLPKSRTRAFFSGNKHEYKIFTDQGGFSGSAGPLTLRCMHRHTMDICKDKSTLTSIRSTLVAPKSKALAFPETT